MVAAGAEVGAGARAVAEIFGKLEPEPHKNDPSSQPWPQVYKVREHHHILSPNFCQILVRTRSKKWNDKTEGISFL
jgi:hypothetical protein